MIEDPRYYNGPEGYGDEDMPCHECGDDGLVITRPTSMADLGVTLYECPGCGWATDDMGLAGY